MVRHFLGSRPNDDGRLLAPLGRKTGLSHRFRAFAERLPAVAAPIAVTVVGCMLIFVALGILLGDNRNAEPMTAEHPADAQRPTPTRTATAEPAAPATADPSDAMVTVADMPPADPEQQDMHQTASILSAVPHATALVPSVPVAETDEEIRALEAIQRNQLETDMAPATDDDAVAVDAEEASPPMRAAMVTTHVNMRAGAEDSAEVLLVVPAQAAIQAEEDCGWCAVVYDGRAGYIYRDFISYR